MSRLGKQLIVLPEKVEFSAADGAVTFKGPLGSLTRRFSPRVEIKQTPEGLRLSVERQDAATRALWGTTAAHLKNMVAGVTRGFEKKLLIEGVGFRFAVAGDKVTLNLGFSHPVSWPIPAGLKVTVEKNLMTVNGIDKELVGQFAAEIRALKKPEPYKGKGIRYEKEVIRRKEGKKVVT